jgi:threonine aldolase
MTEILFGSDNQAGVSPQIMEAILRSDEGIAVAYGDDVHSARLNAAFSEIFEHEAFVFSAATGTAANALGLAAITPPYGETICHEGAHILTTEGGAPEFYAGGSRLVGIAGSNGKISPDDLRSVLEERMWPSRHHYACSSLSLTQATEFGTLYTLGELQLLSETAHGKGLHVHMDGARFTNALVALDVSPAAMSWRAGIDVLSLGTTKNGTMNAEAVIVFDKALARDIAHRQKRAGLLTSKMRYVSAQLLAFLDGDLWLRNARRANSTAIAVARIFESVPGIRLTHPVQTNQIFVDIEPAVTALLETSGVRFRSWDHRQPTRHRLVMSFQNEDQKVERVRAALAPAIAGAHA